MTDKYSADYISAFYDQYGEREWERLVRTPRDRVSFHIHRHYLQQFIRSGDRVLEAGAGPGRFTIELAHLGARITVGDISPGQLAMNAARVAEAGCESSVERREQFDILDLSRYATHNFDAVVCYGGALSYVFDHAPRGLAEMLRVTRPGGHVLLSVMSLLGATRIFFDGVLEIAREHGLPAIDSITATGDLLGPVAQGHHCHMFRWSELAALLDRPDCRLVVASAANYLSAHVDLAVASEAADPILWQRLLDWELEFCREPGALDGGTHILAVVQRI